VPGCKQALQPSVNAPGQRAAVRPHVGKLIGDYADRRLLRRTWCRCHHLLTVRDSLRELPPAT